MRGICDVSFVVVLFATACFTGVPIAVAATPSEIVMVWPGLAPGETESSTGTVMPMRPSDDPPITRVEDIRNPEMEVYLPTTKSNGAAVLILPGGGFVRVVPDLEGSEAAEWLGKLGVTTFVLKYRTTKPEEDASLTWKRPLQDSQRAMRWIRANAPKWNLEPNRIGLLAFSAGGQVGATLITRRAAAYERLDEVDQQSFLPNFAMLVYPWRMYDADTDGLISRIQVSPKTPPTFIVHTHDDNSTSLGAVLFYADLKRHAVPAELHVYENGGHGYGTRPRLDSNIGTWTDRAADWLQRKL